MNRGSICIIFNIGLTKYIRVEYNPPEFTLPSIYPLFPNLWSRSKLTCKYYCEPFVTQADCDFCVNM